MRLAAVALFFIGLAALPADAREDGPDVKDGQRVRLWAVGAETLAKVAATVVHRDAREMTVRVEGSRQLRVVPCRAIVRLEVSAGRRRHPWRGAIVGFVIGVAAAFVADEVHGRAYRGDVADPLYSALAGAALGAGTGYVLRTERWERANWPRPDDGVHDGTVLRVGFRF